jgi:HSP20 family protein
MEQFFGRRDAGLAPAIDMVDRKEKIVLRADLPGLEQKDVEVSVENNTLTVCGEPKAEKETKDEDYYAASVERTPSSAA